jgi:S-adenosylmethionine:tRNA ribosyltransferase-isomerase
VSHSEWPEFDLPPGREAHELPEERGVDRDGVRLLVSDPSHDVDHTFRDLRDLVRPGDLVVVNESATLPASLPARGRCGGFRMHLSTGYSPHLWVAEPRGATGQPGPIPLSEGELVEVAGLPARWIGGYPGIPRLGFLRFDTDPTTAIQLRGRPIRYAYLDHDHPLAAYQTVFAKVPGSAEMASAGRPFSDALVHDLRAHGIKFASILLHAGVSSLESDRHAPVASLLYPEPFHVPAATVEAVARTRRRGGRVVAVGTTVARALESAAPDGCLRPARGFTRVYLSPARPITTFDALVTGFHTATSTHLALLAAFVGAARLERAYRSALDRGYLWHEFGDSHLILRDDPPRSVGERHPPGRYDPGARPARARNAW